MKKENMEETIGDRIRQIRGKLTQKEFADMLGVGRTSVLRYESGERTPDAEFLVKLNVLYKIQPMWLLTGQGQDVVGERLAADEALLLNNYRACSEANRLVLKATSAALTGAQPAVKPEPRLSKTAVVFTGEYHGKRTGPQIISEHPKAPPPAKKRKDGAT